MSVRLSVRRMHDTDSLWRACHVDPVFPQYFLDVYGADQLPCQAPYLQCTIANTDPIDLPGQHWVGLFWNVPEQGDSFDSCPCGPRASEQAGNALRVSSKPLDPFSNGTVTSAEIMPCTTSIIAAAGPLHRASYAIFRPATYFTTQQSFSTCMSCFLPWSLRSIWLGLCLMPVDVVRFVFNTKDIVTACNKNILYNIKRMGSKKSRLFSFVSVMATT